MRLVVAVAAAAAVSSCSSSATKSPVVPPAPAGGSAAAGGPSSAGPAPSPAGGGLVAARTSSPSGTPSFAGKAPTPGLGFDPVAGRCHSSQLAMTDDGGQGAGGTFYGRVVLRSVGRAACSLFGYAGLQRLDSGHGPEPTTVVRAGRAPVRFDLAPQTRASFAYRYSDVLPNGQSCAGAPTASYVQVTPPDETAAVTVRSAMRPCRPGGRVEVSPLRLGTMGSAASEF